MQEAHRALVKHKGGRKKESPEIKETDSTFDGVAVPDDAAEGQGADIEIARYQSYRPKYVTLGRDHPDPIVESKSLEAVSVPKIWYSLDNFKEDAENGAISSAQLETVAYAMQRFRGERLPNGARGGFFLGDGAGVGKGRQIAAVIKEMWLNGTRRVLWLSHCNDLREDARRDMLDMNIDVPSANRSNHGQPRIDVWPRGNMTPPAGKDLKQEVPAGVFFATYSLLIAGCKGVSAAAGRKQPDSWKKPEDAEGGRSELVQSRRGKAESEFRRALTNRTARCASIIEWLKGDESDMGPLIVLDECHKAKNLLNATGIPTLTGFAVMLIQEMCPNAAVLYSSATGISEPNNMAYMTRLGAFGYESVLALIADIGKCGLGASELFSCSLKASGIYLARQLSYEGAEFQLDKVKLDHIFQVQYSRSAAMWQLLDLIVLNKAVFGEKNAKGKRRNVRGIFWGDHQRFFKSMLMAAKVPALAKEAAGAVRSGHSVVVGLQSTGASSLDTEKQAQGDDMDEIFSASKVQMSRIISKYLADAPSCECDPAECMSEAAKVVAAVVCFAMHLLENGTAAEEATKLAERASADAEARSEARRARADERRARKAARAAARSGYRSNGAGEEEEEDLEDSEVDEEDLGEDGAKGGQAGDGQGDLLSCVSLSKAMLDFIKGRHERRRLCAPLNALVTKTTGLEHHDAWGLTQHDLEQQLIDADALLCAEQRRRQKIEQELAEVERRQHWAQRVEAAAKAHDAALVALTDFEAAAVGAAGASNVEALGPDSPCLASQGERAGGVLSTRRGGLRALVDSDDDYDMVSPSVDAARGGGKADYRVGTRMALKQGAQVLGPSDDADEGDAEDGPASVSEQGALDGGEGESVAKRHRAWTSRRRLHERSNRGASGGEAGDSVGGAGGLQGGPRCESGSKRSSSCRLADERCAARINRAKKLRLDYEQCCAAEGMSIAEVEARAAKERPLPPLEDSEVRELACMVCKKKEDDEEMVICDWCNGGVHMYCHQPPLARIPDEDRDWHCFRCTSEQADAIRAFKDAHALAVGLRAQHHAALCRAGVSEAEMLEAMAALLAGEGPAESASSEDEGGVSGAAAGLGPSVVCGGETGPGVAKKRRVSRDAAGGLAMPGVMAVLGEPEQNEGSSSQQPAATTSGPIVASRARGEVHDALEDSDADGPEHVLYGSGEYFARKRALELAIMGAEKKLVAVRGAAHRAHHEAGARVQASSVREARVAEGRASGGRSRREQRTRQADDVGDGSESSRYFTVESESAGSVDDEDDALGLPDEDFEGDYLEESDTGTEGVDYMTIPMKLSRKLYDYKKPEAGTERPPNPVTMMIKRVLTRTIDLLELPPNPLDYLIHLCGGREVVAEMTGRKEMMECMSDGTFRAVRRAQQGVSQQQLNIYEKNLFMDGHKRIAIISDAASTGISLQADRNRANTTRRVHMTLELPWSADKAIQQFGRSHRSNQVSAPIYKILMTPAAGEFRFAASAANRLRSLGALLKGNRDALGAGQSLAEFDIDHQYGDAALLHFIRELTGLAKPHGAMDETPGRDGVILYRPQIPTPAVPDHLECPNNLPEINFANYPKDLQRFYNCARTWCSQVGILERDNMNTDNDKVKHTKKITAFMNRVLGLNLQQQQIIFGYFQCLLDIFIDIAKARGTFNAGVRFLSGDIACTESNVIWHMPGSGHGEIRMTRMMQDQGLSFEEAEELVDANKAKLQEYRSWLKVGEVGFYVRKRPTNVLGTGRDRIALITGTIQQQGDGGMQGKHLVVRFPWSRGAKRLRSYEVMPHWRLARDRDTVKALWDFWYNFSDGRCQHIAPCKRCEAEGYCPFNNRKERITLLHGLLLPAWSCILNAAKEGVYKENVYEDESGREKRSKTKLVGGDVIQMASVDISSGLGAGGRITGAVLRARMIDVLLPALKEDQRCRVAQAQTGMAGAVEARQDVLRPQDTNQWGHDMFHEVANAKPDVKADVKRKGAAAGIARAESGANIGGEPDIKPGAPAVGARAVHDFAGMWAEEGAGATHAAAAQATAFQRKVGAPVSAGRRRCHEHRRIAATQHAGTQARAKQLAPAPAMAGASRDGLRDETRPAPGLQGPSRAPRDRAPPLGTPPEARPSPAVSAVVDLTEDEVQVYEGARQAREDLAEAGLSPEEYARAYQRRLQRRSAAGTA